LSIFGAEVIGTALLILLGNGVVAGVLLSQSKAENAGWIVITFGWGMAVMVGVFAIGQFSGAHLNPAVTIGFATIGDTEWSDVPEYIGGEFVGAFIGATLVWLSYLPHWGAT
jgi:glycerol uptake facilitator protein